MATEHTRRSRSFVALLALIVASALTIAGPAPARADRWSDVDFSYSMINQARSVEGVAPVAWDGDLAELAQSWAEDLAWNGWLAHNPRLSDQMWAWWSWGENVGWGWSIESIQHAWYWSGHHYDNMVSPNYTSVGIGIAYGWDGSLYAVQVFGG